MRHRRLLLGWFALIQIGMQRERSRVRDRLLRRFDTESDRREAEVPRHVSLGRDRRVDPARQGEAGGREAQGSDALLLSRRWPWFQLRTAWLVQCRCGAAGAYPHARVPEEARRLSTQGAHGAPRVEAC